jgi:hypothetical protein
MKRMLSSRDPIMVRKIDMLPISIVDRNLAHANYAAAEAIVARVARAVAWLRAFVASTHTDKIVLHRRHSH